MKYKLFAGAMAVVMLFCALAASAMEAQVGPYRVHQHQTARQPGAGCGCGGTELCTPTCPWWSSTPAASPSPACP